MTALFNTYHDWGISGQSYNWLRDLLCALRKDDFLCHEIAQ
jgi:hypothetical protein